MKLTANRKQHGTFVFARRGLGAKFRFVLDDSLRGYWAGLSLDLLASLLLVWATAGLRGWPSRLSLALALFACLHLFGGWRRDPQELAFSVTVLLWVVGFGAHARSVAAAQARQQTLRRSASWAQYWQGQAVGFLRQVAFEALAGLALLALLTLEGRLVLKAVGNPSRSASRSAIAQARAALRSCGGQPVQPRVPRVTAQKPQR